MRLPLKHPTEEKFQVCKVTFWNNSNWVKPSCPHKTYHSTDSLCWGLPPDPSARNQSVLIKLIAFIYFTYLNLTWPTWKAQRIIFTSPHGMKHKRNMTFWFGHFPYSALRQVSHDEGKKQSGQEKLSSLQNSNSPLLDKCWLIHSFFTRQKQSSDFVNSKCQQGMAAQLLKRWRMKQGFAAADSSPPSTQT